jgi:hypothetical protein
MGNDIDSVLANMEKDLLGSSQSTPQPTGQVDQVLSQMDNEVFKYDPESLIKKYFPPEEWDRAKNVMMGESGGRSDAVGDNYPIRGETIPSVGLFQIRTLPGRPTAEQLKNPELNVKYAADMQKNQGWGPWTVAHNLGYVN